MTDWHVDKNAEAKTMVITAELKGVKGVHHQRVAAGLDVIED